MAGVACDTALGVVGASGGLTSVGKVSVDEVRWEQARHQAQTSQISGATYLALPPRLNIMM